MTPEAAAKAARRREQMALDLAYTREVAAHLALLMLLARRQA